MPNAPRNPNGFVSRHPARSWVRRLLERALLSLALLAAAARAGSFQDATVSVGIADYEKLERHPSDFVVRGGSPIVMDFDGNGWPDLYIVRYQLDDLLFLNNAGTFTTVVNPLGLDTKNGGNVGAWADIDNDGDKDMIVAVADEKQHRLYLNGGDGSFTEEAADRGLSLPSSAKNHQGTGVTVGDVNRDGYLDVIIADWGVDVDEETRFEHYALFLNRGEEAPGNFTNVTQSSGYEFFAPNITFFSPTITDLDADGWPDIASVVDFGKSAIHWNNADGTFSNTTTESGVGLENHGMGTAIGDIDNDGDLDWWVTTIAMTRDTKGEVNPLYVNQGGRLFQNKSVEAGVAFGGWGWGTNMFDYDIDGDLDIVMVNQEDLTPEGPVNAGEMFLWRNEGNLTFTDVSDAEGANYLTRGAGLVTFDYDNDGDLDMFVVNQNSSPLLLRNRLSIKNSWLKVSLEGVVSNRDGIGALVSVQPQPNGPVLIREFNPTNAYLAQLDFLTHFGFSSSVNTLYKVEVRWPSGIVQELTDVQPNQILHIVEDESLFEATEPPVFTEQPQQQNIEPGQTLTLTVAFEGLAQPTIQWYKNDRLIAGQTGKSLVIEEVSGPDSGTYHAVATNNAGSAKSAAAIVSVSSLFPGQSIARQWNEAILAAVRVNFPDPTFVSRNLYHSSAAMWDAFWPYQPGGWGDAQPVFVHEAVEASSWSGSSREAAQAQAISHAVFRVVDERYKVAHNSDAIRQSFRFLMDSLGYDPDNTTTEGNSPAAVGNRIGYGILAATLNDGSNEANGFADTTGYQPVNEPLIYGTTGVTLVDPNRWQPLSLAESITKNGINKGAETQAFLTPGWNAVTPFALQKPTDTTILIDPGPQPLFGAETESQYIAEAVEVIRASSYLDPDDGVVIDVSPAAMQNNAFGAQNGSGRPLNPITGEPYQPNLVKRGDYWRLTAEFWSDGPGIEGPPGVWNMLHNQVTDDPRFVRSFGGASEPMAALEWDVHAYLAINGALHDAAIAAWTVKAKYDSVRPISMIRYLASLGQSSDPDAPSYHPSGLPLEPGLIELITEASSAPGERHEHLADHVGEIALRCWQGLPEDPETQTAGVGWIRAANWTPYHLRGFPTPNFAGYVSGHSTFSRAGAEILRLLTGTPYFPGGLKEFHFPQGQQFQVEYGPSEDITVQVATYYDAADLTGVARIFCGVHIAADDFVGRKMGARIGLDAYQKVLALRSGSSNLDAVETARIRHDVSGGADALLAEFAFAGDSQRPNGLNVVRNRNEGESAPLPGIYAIYPGIPGNDGPNLEILSKGQPVEKLAARSVLEPGRPIEIEFVVETSAPLLVIATGASAQTGSALSSPKLKAYRLANGAAVEIGVNQSWLSSDTSSIVTTFAEKKNADAQPLRDDSVALPLSLESGSYRITLEASNSSIPAALSLELVR